MGEQAPSSPARKTCFPFKLLCVVVQDVAHFCVLGALTIGLALLIVDFTLALSRRRCRATCGTEAVDAIFILPCTVLLGRMLQRYDPRHRPLLRQVDNERMKIDAATLKAVEDAQDFLKRKADGNVVSSEHCFATLRKDFLRFLRRIQGKIEAGEWKLREEAGADAYFVQALRGL